MDLPGRPMNVLGDALIEPASPRCRRSWPTRL
jgi:hypothetical protein